MSFWNEDEFVQGVTESRYEESPDLIEEDEQLSEVERRLEIASFYRLLLNDRLFESENPAAHAVEKEIRTYIRARLEVLVGMRSEASVQTPSANPFSAEETVILKSIAAKLQKKPSILESVAKPKPPPPPAVRKVKDPEKEKPKPEGIKQTKPVARKQAKQVKVEDKIEVTHPKTGQKRLMSNKKQVKGSTSLPPPDKAQLEAVLAHQANQQAASTPLGGALIQAAINHSVGSAPLSINSDQDKELGINDRL